MACKIPAWRARSRLVGLSLILLVALAALAVARGSMSSPSLPCPSVIWVVVSFFTNHRHFGLRLHAAALPLSVHLGGQEFVPRAVGLRARGLRSPPRWACDRRQSAGHRHRDRPDPSPLPGLFQRGLRRATIHGSEHLIDSSLDWGQDLVNLRRWAQEHAPREKIGLAYFGQINPQGLQRTAPGPPLPLVPACRLPSLERSAELPSRDDRLGAADDHGPEPGLYAIKRYIASRRLPWRGL